MKSIVTVHATQTTAKLDMSGRDVDRRDRMHGFSRCGYHYVISRDGTVYEGRPAAASSVHDDPEEARDAMSFCLVGGCNDANAPEDNFTEVQWDAFRTLLTAVGSEHPFTRVRSKTPSLTTERVNRAIWRMRCT